MGCGWTLPLLSEGFICGGEMLSFGIPSNALMVIIMTGFQLSPVFSTCNQGKKNRCCNMWRLFETRDVLLDVVWKSCESGGKSKKFLFEVPVLYLILPLISYRNRNKGAVLFAGLSGCYSYSPALGRRGHLLSPAQEADFLMPSEPVAQPSNRSGHPLCQRGTSVILTGF